MENSDGNKKQNTSFINVKKGWGRGDGRVGDGGDVSVDFFEVTEPF